MALGRYWIFALSFGFSSTAAAREAILIDFNKTRAAMPSNESEGPVETALRSAWEGSMPSPQVARRSIPTSQMDLRLQETGGKSAADDLGTETRRCFAPSYRPMTWLDPRTEQRRALFYSGMVKIACETGIPAALLDATITHESAYRPWARSSAGAMGMMQLIPATARSLGLTDPWNPLENLRAGARYLRLQLDRFGRFDLALAAYNAGPERKSLAAGSIPRIPETVRYVRAITSNWVRMTQPESLQPGAHLRLVTSSDVIQRSRYREPSLIQFGGFIPARVD